MLCPPLLTASQLREVSEITKWLDRLDELRQTEIELETKQGYRRRRLIEVLPKDKNGTNNCDHR